MSRAPIRVAVALGAGLALLALAACGDSGSAGSSGRSGAEQGGGKTIEVTLVDAGCDPSAISTTSGPTTFHVTNKGAAGVTEFEILSGKKIIGEVENVAPGLDRSLSITLEAGAYTTKCSGGTNEEGTLTVSDAPAGHGASTSASAAGSKAVQTYLAYVKEQADALVTATRAFTDAVRAGDVAKAKSAFASARVPYETIEPIAESFGDLDPAIDARDGDVPADQWTGFHRIEKALWVDGDVASMGPIADRLDADVAKLQSLITTLQFEPAQIANGAVELLNEVSSSKITGEEDRYSHTDLSDFAANLAGAKAAFGAVRPILAVGNLSLAQSLDQRFSSVQAALDVHKSTTGPAGGYVTFDTLQPEQTRTLSTSVDSLAEPLSQVAALVIG